MEKILKSEDTNILVTGDYIVDRNLLPGSRRFAADAPDTGTRLIDVFGGSLLTYEMLNSIISGNKTSIKCSFDLKIPNLKEFISGYPARTAYSIWTKCKDDSNWKIDEIKGYGFSASKPEEYPYKKEPSSVSGDWIVIDEGNLGFRNCDDIWCDFTGKKVLLKCSHPFLEGKLIQKLTQKHSRPELLIVVVTLSNLRKSDVKISSDISWEQTALDITAELRRNTKLNVLLKSDHLIVMVGASGAIHFHNKIDPMESEVSLVFDPSHIESEWELSTPLLPGSGSCFLASGRTFT